MSINKDDLLLVLLYANWCGHCRNFYKKDSNNSPLDLKDIKSVDKNELTWQQVKKDCGIKTLQFEEKELEKGGNIEGVTLDELNKFMSEGKGWPTIVMLKKNGDKYNILKQFEKSRNDMKNFEEFIEECKSSEQKGGSINYRHKYKKYKVMYRELMQKYKQAGGK